MRFDWEIDKSEKHIPWKILIVIGLVSFSSAAYFFIVKSYFAFALFIIVPIVVLLISLHGPSKVIGNINQNGITINNKKYEYSSLESFAIIYGNLILKTKEGGAQYLPIHEEDGNDLREVLSEYISEKEYDESLIEMMNRYLRIH